MPSSFSNLTFHLVFSTKYRRPVLMEKYREVLYPYISGIIEHHDGRLMAIGGMEDHVHILVKCSPTIAIADLVRDIKANSSKWMHEEQGMRGFAWQVGYAAFSVSQSQIEAVQTYIETQAEHHRVWSFEDEFRQILLKHNITYDPRYLFEEERGL